MNYLLQLAPNFYPCDWMTFRACKRTGLGYLYMMHFVSAIPNSGPYHEFKEFNNTLPYKCATSTLRSDENGVVQIPTGPGLGIEIDPAHVAKHQVVKT